MTQFHTLSGPVAVSLNARLSDLEWTDGDLDGEATLDADVGQLALTVYPDREPPEWSVTVVALDQAVGGDLCTVRGTALSAASAQIDAAMAAPELLDRAVRYLTGEITGWGGSRG